MVTLMPDENTVNVFVDGVQIGTVRLSDNPFHKRNCYIDLCLDVYDNTTSAELFEELAQWVQRPLQAMVSSEDVQKTDFLTAGGFICKRKCYEVDAEKDDYIGATAQTTQQHACAGESAYDLCCEIMYRHYIKNHRNVNPWTAGLSDFCDRLPEEVIYSMSGEEITNVAFVEGGEIAYVCCDDRSRFNDFAASLIAELFEKHETIFFESDDCDWAAMQLRSMFINQGEVSFDAYIYASGSKGECYDQL